MKYLKILMSLMLLSIATTACSSFDDAEIVEISNIPIDADSIDIPISLDIRKTGTRAEDFSYSVPNWSKLFFNGTDSEWSSNNHPFSKYTWIPFKVKRDTHYSVNADYFKYTLKGKIYLPKADKFITFDEQSVDNLYWNKDQYSFQYKVRIPRDELASDCKVDFMLTQNPFTYDKSSTLDYRSWTNAEYFNNGLYFCDPSSFKAKIDDLYGASYSFPLSSAVDNFNRQIIIPTEYYSFYGSGTVLNSNGDINTGFNLEDLNSYIVVLTDEFQSESWPNVNQNNFNEGTWFERMFISSLDCKSNRRLSEYITGYNDDNFYDAKVLDKTCFNDYSISFINPITKQQVNAVRKITIKDGSSYRGFGQMTNPLTEKEGIADCPYFTYLNVSTTSLFKKNGEDSRMFHLVAQRILSMPYGIPNTLSQASKTSFETHINKSEDLNKPLKYLVINCFDYETSTQNASHKYRAAIPIPEDGFKPGCVYMITNKPGTKLFKEWDEENGTTRAGDTDYIVDQSCLQIEEIQL